MKLRLEFEQETDDRWISEITMLPGVMAYGASREEPLAAAEALALQVIADRIENGQMRLESSGIRFEAA